jgi:hypothetical protein
MKVPGKGKIRPIWDSSLMHLVKRMKQVCRELKYDLHMKVRLFMK